MPLISEAYLLIFLPLILATFCHFFAKKIISFLITLLCLIALLFLLNQILPKILLYQSITNDFRLSILSLALEFKIDMAGIGFLLLLVLTKIAILVSYFPTIQKLLNEKNGRIFYSAFLIQIFTLIGLITTNSLLNLLVFFEIYAFGFFAISSIYHNAESLKISFRYFCLSSASSLLAWFCFFTIFLITGEIGFDEIFYLLPSIAKASTWFLTSLFLIIMGVITIRFFPFWLYLAQLKSNRPGIDFLITNEFLSRSIVGSFLLLKFIYFFFGQNLLFDDLGLSPTLNFLGIILIFYSSFKFYQKRDLKFYSIYLGLNMLGFIIACLALHSDEAMRAMFFYILSFTALWFLMLIFENSSPKAILPWKLLMLLVMAFLIAIPLIANWYFASASYYESSLKSFLFPGVIFSNFSLLSLLVRLLTPFFSDFINKTAARSFMAQYRFYLIISWVLIWMICAIVFITHLFNDFSLRLAAYMLD